MARALSHFGWMVLLLLIGSLAVPSAARADAAAEAAVERMLQALGGRPAWARVTNTVNDSQQNILVDPPVLRVVITMDFERPRVLIDTTAPGLHVARAMNGDRHWRRNRAGELGPIPDDVLADDRRFHAGHVYRTLSRLARRDPALRVALGQDGRLEVHETGARIAWYLLDVRGEPYRYGAHGDDTGSVFGPWDRVQDGIHHPAWVSRPDGSWRAMLKELRVNVPLSDAMFERPER
jgi:hypothetical protein